MQMRYKCAVCSFHMNLGTVATNSQHLFCTVMNMMDTRLARGLTGTIKADKKARASARSELCSSFRRTRTSARS